MPSFWVISISLAFLIYDAKYVLDMYIVFIIEEMALTNRYKNQKMSQEDDRVWFYEHSFVLVYYLLLHWSSNR